MNILENIDKLEKNFDRQYDFYKHLTTISSGAILFIAAFMRNDVQGVRMILVIFSIISFLLSIIFSLWTMLNVGMQIERLTNFQINAALKQDDKAKELADTATEAFDGINLLGKSTTYTFAAGMLFIIVSFICAIFKA